MIGRYTSPEMGRIWSDQRKYETWLQVETAAADAMARAGIVPADAARDIRERGRFDIERIEEIEQVTQHDVIAFTTAVAEHVGPSARWLHFGLTSSDVIDTAQALQMRDACDLILAGLDGLMQAVRQRADEHRRTPMIGRTHGVHAEPMTFGLKLALWYAELARDVTRVRRARETVSVGKLSGAVGTFAHLPPSIEADVCRTPRPRAGAGRVAGDSARPPRGAADGAGDHRLVARKVRAGDSRPAEDRDRRGRGAVRQGPEGLVGDAAQAQPDRLRADRRASRGWCAPTPAPRSRTTRSWHERDISHSSVERVILPDSFIALDHMLRRFTRIVTGMVVYPDRMRENLERSRGVVFSGTVLLELARRGVSREQAYEWVQRNAMRAFNEQRDFKTLLLADRDITAALPAADIERAFDLDEQLRHVDDIFEPRVPGGNRLMRARVFVTLKPSVFDPQGTTVAEALHTLGYAAVKDVRQGKYFELDIDAKTR